MMKPHGIMTMKLMLYEFVVRKDGVFFCLIKLLAGLAWSFISDGVVREHNWPEA
jgi:hypothetical protein